MTMGLENPQDFKDAVQSIARKAAAKAVKSVAEDVDSFAQILKWNTEELVRRATNFLKGNGG